MNTQYLEYLRQQIILATTDFSHPKKGQLEKFAENALSIAKSDSTGCKKNVGFKAVRQSRATGSHIPLIRPAEYASASWRRATMSLKLYEKGWLLWCYGGNTEFEYQTDIVKWGWARLQLTLADRKVAAKTVQRLQQFVWLAAQVVKAELAGRETYRQAELARLAGVSPGNWCKNYKSYWDAMKIGFHELDARSLLRVAQVREEQKRSLHNQALNK